MVTDPKFYCYCSSSPSDQQILCKSSGKSILKKQKKFHCLISVYLSIFCSRNRNRKFSKHRKILLLLDQRPHRQLLYMWHYWIRRKRRWASVYKRRNMCQLENKLHHGGAVQRTKGQDGHMKIKMTKVPFLLLSWLHHSHWVSGAIMVVRGNMVQRKMETMPLPSILSRSSEITKENRGTLVISIQGKIWQKLLSLCHFNHHYNHSQWPITIITLSNHRFDGPFRNRRGAYMSFHPALTKAASNRIGVT